MAGITTHVLNTAKGKPAQGIAITLEVLRTKWELVGRGTTDGDGRLKDLAAGKSLNPGTHRLTFETGAYFSLRKMDGLYPQVVIVFEVKDARDHYHIPLLLSPYGYSTYRGS